MTSGCSWVGLEGLTEVVTGHQLHDHMAGTSDRRYLDPHVQYQEDMPR